MLLAVQGHAKDQQPCDTPKPRSRKPFSTPTSKFGIVRRATSPSRFRQIFPSCHWSSRPWRLTAGKTMPTGKSGCPGICRQSEETIAWVLDELNDESCDKDFERTPGT